MSMPPVSRQPVIFKKHRTVFIWLYTLLLGLSAFTLLLPFAAAGVSSEALEILWFTLPLSIMLFALSALVWRRMHLRVLIDTDGVVFEDLSHDKIPWSDITQIDRRAARLHGRHSENWLVIELDKPHLYASTALLFLGQLRFGGALPVCQLDSYQESEQLLATLQSQLHDVKKPL